MARTMLCENNLPRYFQVEVINTACYILNRALIRRIIKKTIYELWKDKKSNIGYFYVFGYRYFVHNNGKKNLEKFDAKSDEGIFLGYFISNKEYRIFNKRTLVIEESIHVAFGEPSQHKEKTVEEEKNILENKIDKINLNETETQDELINKTPRKQQDQELSKS